MTTSTSDTASPGGTRGFFMLAHTGLMRLLLLSVLLIVVAVLLTDVLIAVFYRMYETTTPALLLAALLAWCLTSFALQTYQERGKLRGK